MKRHRQASPRGFTLLELMTTAAIVGVLASVAIPEFGRLLIRSKTAERTYVLQHVRRMVYDQFIQNGSLPPLLAGGWNPVPPETQAKRVFDFSQPGWKTIFPGGGEIEGTLYYSYLFQAIEVASPPLLLLMARGDLDGDGVPSDKIIWLQRIEGVYQTLLELPAAGSEDGATF
jgi:prepilin-type N-terminal cleavage/methylation domain-containing protein